MYGQYFVLFAILFTGYFLRKINFIDEAMNNGLNKFIVYFAYPCMIVVNLGALELNRKLMFSFLLMLALSIACFGLYSLWMYWYCKWRKVPKKEANIVELSAIFPNNGFMGFPIALLFFGGQGFFLMLAHNAAMNFYFFSYGIRAMRRNKDGRRKNTPGNIVKSIIKLLLNPNIVALFIGFAISATHTTLAAPIEQYLSLIGNVATPMAMIFIGSTLATCKILEIIKNHIVIEATLNKLIVLPVLTFVVVYFLPVPAIIKAILILACCFPAAATVSMVAQQEGEDQAMASKILFLSTILSLVTIPFAIKLINLFIM